MALEREQVELLAERLLVVIDELERRGLAAIGVSRASTGSTMAWNDPEALTASPHEEFEAGTLTIAWDEDVDRMIIEARSPTLDDGAGEVATPVLQALDDDDVPDDAPIGPDVLRVRLRPVMAQQFARQAERVVASGRSPCPFCGEPLDPGGHLCSRRNGPEYLH